MFNKDLIAAILDKKGWSRYKLCKEANLAQSTLSDILSGKNANPRMDTIQKIATALGVDVNEFFDNTLAIDENYIDQLDKTLCVKEEAEKYTLSKKAEKDIQKSLSDTLNLLQESQGGLMFDGEPLDDETRELLAQSIENSMRLAKKIAKEKYTPKKYRK